MKKHLKSYALFTFSLVWFTFAFAGDAPDTLKVIHISDSHICFLSGYHPVFVNTRKYNADNADDLSHFFRTLPGQADASAVVITGDLLDFYEAKAATGKILAGQIERLYPIFQQCPAPLFAILGNHDVTSYAVNEKDSTVQKYQSDAGKARANWIREMPCFHDGAYYSHDFKIGAMQVRFVFLDNGYYLSNGNHIDKAQLDWLKKQVWSAGDMPVLLFMHIYLPVGDTNGDGIFFKQNNLTWPDSAACSTGFLKLLNKSKNIKAIFVGHGHKNIMEWINFPSEHKILQCETGSLGDSISNWRMLWITSDKLIISHPGFLQKQMILNLK